MAVTAGGRSATLRVSIVVPTLGASRLLGACLAALRKEAADGAELIVVAQGEVDVPVSDGAAAVERTLRCARPLGFAGAVNRGIAAGAAPYVAVVNDDAVVEPGWLAALVAALDGAPEAAAAQGVNLLGTAETPRAARIDGWGLGWNRRLQAVQLGHGAPAAAAPDGPREVFGVSATAALYRRRDLAAVARPSAGGEAAAEIFDSRLEAYYEDADLALRLRAAGHRALSIPAARVWHGGSLTVGGGVGRWRRVYGNRHLVLADALGSAFWRWLPALALRDLVDWTVAVGTGRPRRAAGIVAGWARAARRLPGFVRGGPPRLDPAVLRTGGLDAD